MKKCSKCKEEKPLDEFYKDRRATDGCQPSCKDCHNRAARERYHADPKSHMEKTKAWVERNKERSAAIKKAYRDRNKDKQSDYNKRWREANPEKHVAKEARRRAAKLDRTPQWLTKDHHWMIEECYSLSRLRSSITGVTHHVDHIVPLRGKKVSGLHVPWNLQVIPATDNCSKGNKHG
jgi:hypothetical protein